MYQAEVLGKLPVVQHFLFGSILIWEGVFPEGNVCGDLNCGGHDHVGAAGQKEVGWGDCCGITVPSVFAAANAEKAAGARLEGSGIKPVPFD